MTILVALDMMKSESDGKFRDVVHDEKKHILVTRGGLTGCLVVRGHVLLESADETLAIKMDSKWNGQKRMDRMKNGKKECKGCETIAFSSEGGEG